MAHFYGTIQNHRNKISRTGHKSTGIRVTANGWDIGGEVETTYSNVLKTDVVAFYRTSGSNSINRHHIASFAKIDDTFVEVENSCLKTDI